MLCRCAILEFKSGQEAASCVEGNKDVEVGDHKIRLSHCYPMPDHGQSRHSLGLIGGRGDVDQNTSIIILILNSNS